ncbi:MAG: hypothetical protein JRI86_10900 [Deltaproteobacteria bacterium]|nr:hypothetical protein [Deltaproteobacteria bacterium]
MAERIETWVAGRKITFEGCNNEPSITVEINREFQVQYLEGEEDKIIIRYENAECHSTTGVLDVSARKISP